MGGVAANGETTFVKSLGLISRAERHRYFVALKEVLAHCIDHDVVEPFRQHVRRWIRRGAPIDPAAYYAPDPSLRIVIRQMVSTLGAAVMGHRAFDARLWLTEPEARLFDPESGLVVGAPRLGNQKFFKSFAPNFVPWNCFLHAPEGTPYAAFNRRGLEVAMAEETPDDEPWVPRNWS